MAVRFTSIFYDVDGIQWTLKILDDDHTGNSTDLRLTGNGFTTKWEGSETSPYIGIMPSSTSIECINEGGDFDTFLSEIANKNEGSVRVEIYDNVTPSTTSSTQFWWGGVVLIDGIQQEDRPAPTVVTLQAIDDLATLKDIRWDSDLPDGYPASFAGPGGIATILLKCLHRCRNFQSFSSSSPMLRTVLDFQIKGYDVQQFGSSYQGPKILEQISAGIGFAENEVDPVDGFRPRWFMWDILQSLAITFNARLFWARGCWNFWPVNVHFMDAEGGVAEGEVNWADRVYGYSASGGDLTFPAGGVGQLANLKRYHLPGIQMGLNVSSETHPERDALTKIDGGLKTYSTPVKFVKRQQDWTHTYAISGQSYILNGTAFASVQGNGTDPDHHLTHMNRLTRLDFTDDREFFAGASFQINLSGNFSRPANAYPGTADTCKLKVHIVWDVGDYRWKGQNDGWSTDQTGEVTWYVGQDSFSDGVNIPLSMEHSTAGHPLPADSDSMSLTISYTIHNGYGGDITSNLVTGTEASQQTTFMTTVFQCVFLNGENTNELHFIAETDRQNTVTLDQGTTLFGSTAGAFTDIGDVIKLPAPFGPLGGFPWMDDNKWGSWHDVDQDLNLNRLGVNEIAGMMEVGREIETGDLKVSSDCNPLTPLNTLRTRDVIGGSYDQDYWLPLTVTYMAATRTANVSRIRLDWDGALNNISNTTDDEGSSNVDETSGDASTAGDGTNDPVPPNGGGGTTSTGGGGVTFGGPQAKGMLGRGDGRQMVSVLEKTAEIQVDPGNGITGLTVKSGEEILAADAIEETPTRGFIEATERTKLGNITYAGGGIDLDAVATKTGHISADTGGISAVTFKSGTTPVSADAIATTSSKRFLTDANLQAIADNETRSTNAENTTDLLTVTAATDLDTVRTKADQITATSSGISSLTVDGSSQIVPLGNIADDASYKKLTAAERVNKLNHVLGTASGISSFACATGAKPLTADQVNDASSTAKFTDADGVQALGHITSTAAGISSLTTSGGDLSLTDAVAFFDGSTGTALGSRSGVSNDRVAVLESDGGLGELAAGKAGQFLQSGGNTGSMSWAIPPYVLAASSTRLSLYYVNRYYYGSTVFGWDTDTAYSSSQTGKTSLADDYAHTGIVAPTAISTLKLWATIRNDSNAADLRITVLKGSRPNGVTSNITLTELIEVTATVSAADRHYSLDGSATSAGIAAGDLIFVFFSRTELPNGSTFANVSYTLHATP